jgi:tRNA threonylcarbamoyladenosine biosynthesis protein TsaB
MPSLRQLVAAHAPLLLIDAAAARVQAGWFASDGSARWASSGDEAGIGVFRCLEDLGADPGAAGAFLFCAGPGSVLGIRTAAMALRVWRVEAPRPAFSYRSLELVVRAAGRPGLAAIADARRDLWHQFTADGTVGRLPAAELAGTLVMPEGFRHWAPLPPGVELVPYDLPAMLRRAIDADLFSEAGEPDAFLHEERGYATWTPRIHGARGAQAS